MKTEGFLERLETALGNWVVAKRWWILAATLLIVAAAGSGVRFLTFDNEMRSFFSDENPQLQALEAFEDTFTKDELILFALAPADGDVFTPKTLAAVEWLTEAAWQMPYSTRVDSITNFQHTQADGDDLIVRDLVEDAASLSGEALARAREIALSEPLLANRLISSPGDVTGVSVKVILPGKDKDETAETAAFAQDLAERLRKANPGMQVYLTGELIVDNEYAVVSKDDLVTLVPVMFITLIIVLGFALRSFVGTVATLAVTVLSVTTALGVAGWLGMSISSASALAPTMILMLAVADSVHILTTVFQQIGLGNPRHRAIAEALRINIKAVSLTSVTTAIGFFSLNFSDVPPFRDMGTMVGVGVLAAFLSSVAFLPALLAVLPTQLRGASGATTRSCDRLADFVIGRRKPVFLGTLAVAFVVTLGVFKLEVNDDYIKYFGKRYEIRKATDFLEARLTGVHNLEYLLESGESGGISDPAYLKTVENFANWNRNQAKVAHVQTFTDIMKRLNMNMHGDDEAQYALPAQRDLAAQYLLLYEMSLPFGLDLNGQINVDKSATRMTVTTAGTTTKEMRELAAAGEAWLKANAPAEMVTQGTGLSIVWSHIFKRNTISMLWATTGALLLISVLLVAAFRSVKLGLISLVPNLAPALMAFGVWGLIRGEIGLGLSVIVSMTIGIVVDDTVHFLSKYLRARREHGMTPPEAVRFAFNTVGTALWVTTVTLVAGFMVLMLSGYRMNSDMGLMAAITITLALGLDFFLLPTLLMLVDRPRKGSTQNIEEMSDDTREPEHSLEPAGVAAGGGPVA